MEFLAWKAGSHQFVTASSFWPVLCCTMEQASLHLLDCPKRREAAGGHGTTFRSDLGLLFECGFGAKGGAMQRVL
jgi:hypothetical protein